MTDTIGLTPGTQTLTNKLMSKLATERTGWTRAQLEILGISLPPPQGWRKRLVAEKRVLPDAVVTALREACIPAAERRSQLGESPAEAKQKSETISLSATLQTITVTRRRVRRHRQREHDDIVVGDCLTEFLKPVRNWMSENGWLSEGATNDEEALTSANQEILRRLADGAITLAPKARTDD